jgi:hypothetical protein
MWEPTKMPKLKCLGYLWLRICNVANTASKPERKTTLYQDDDQYNVALKQQNHEKIYYIYVKIVYLNKMKK